MSEQHPPERAMTWGDYISLKAQLKDALERLRQAEQREAALREALRPLWNLAEAMEKMPAPVEWERLREPLWDAVQDAATAYAKALAAQQPPEQGEA